MIVQYNLFGPQRTSDCPVKQYWAPAYDYLISNIEIESSTRLFSLFNFFYLFFFLSPFNVGFPGPVLGSVH
jgi:hypothetical protein